ncbi:unnamed protein product [Vitrella brassicaformis CCMP3155]|uniref:Uncharacterized protein n=1 Tax=Vitrella brassicaformis (strain CCMP3155) TaxID=1169540 RepID=A0A0G4ETY2_VITBC|nr:unnamed protein product [Vitrella brassicaformis CCMP3155]|eukprot:CEM01714.1 unnamed protein product [Vitrella brassicaformis CCMP3155]
MTHQRRPRSPVAAAARPSLTFSLQDGREDSRHTQSRTDKHDFKSLFAAAPVDENGELEMAFAQGYVNEHHDELSPKAPFPSTSPALANHFKQKARVLKNMQQRAGSPPVSAATAMACEGQVLPTFVDCGSDYSAFMRIYLHGGEGGSDPKDGKPRDRDRDRERDRQRPRGGEHVTLDALESMGDPYVRQWVKLERLKEVYMVKPSLSVRGRGQH